MPQTPELEIRRRQQSIESVLGSHAMEGLSADQATLDILRRYTQGELTLDEFSDLMDAYARALVAERRTLAGAA